MYNFEGDLRIKKIIISKFFPEIYFFNNLIRTKFYNGTQVIKKIDEKIKSIKDYNYGKENNRCLPLHHDLRNKLYLKASSYQHYYIQERGIFRYYYFQHNY